MRKISSAFLSASVGLLFAVTQVQAQLTNPVLSGSLLQSNASEATSGTTFARYFAHLWRAALSLGAIVVLVFLIWGAIEWITSAGEKGKIESARNKITQAIVGLVILVSSFTLIGFAGQLLFGDSFNVLRITIPSALN